MGRLNHNDTSSSKSPYRLFDESTRAIILNNQPRAVQRMLDFDYVVRREKPSVAAIVNPSGSGFHQAMFGHSEVLIPVFRTVGEASARHRDADVVINFASLRSACETTLAALEEPAIRTVVVIAEGIPEQQARILAHESKARGKWLIGPATVGGIAAGKFKIGNSGGTTDNIIYSKLFRPGHVGFVSKSGGLSNEMYNVISKNSTGICEGISLGGDRFPGSTAVEHLERMDANPDIAMLVYLGEIGGVDEYEIVEAMAAGRIHKPLVAWVSGTCARIFPSEVQFGHAGAKANAGRESADAKISALREGGVEVPSSFDDFGELIKEVFVRIQSEHEVKPFIEPKYPHVPVDFDEALRSKMIRKKPSIISTISDDRGEELTYNGKPISTIIREGYGVGGVISELWFKRRLPDYGIEFIETVLALLADHGPAVSGAHNAIVAARAGKDLVSSLASGLLTIGPRFGGAIDDAARAFARGSDLGMTPEEFVTDFKGQGRPIPGIGHRVKSVENPDKRVELLEELAKARFESNTMLEYARAVEQQTVKKKNTLILNVDGAVGVCFVDLLRSCGRFSREDADRYIELGALNGLFVVGRSIGIIGHYLDQNRLEQPLYRHSLHDISYLS